MSLAGWARIPDVTLAEASFEFGEVTVGGYESLAGTVVNRIPIPASLHLDLSHHPEFEIERAAEASSGGRGRAPCAIGGEERPVEGDR